MLLIAKGVIGHRVHHSETGGTVAPLAQAVTRAAGILYTRAASTGVKAT